jgi:tripartite-type tricarboxylate transporter receptor subunit TctC
MSWAKDRRSRRGAFAGAVKRSTLYAFAGAVLIAALASTAARARDDYPSRPVQMIIPFSAGGPTDIVGRVMGAKMGELLRQQFVVENKTGAGGNIGAEAVAKAAPDGYTILMATVSTNAINPGLYKHIPYDAVHDFAPLGRVGVTPTLLLVHPSIPATDVKSLITLIKANPGKYNYGSSGLGSILHLCGEEFKSLAGGLDITHVPYKGSAPMDTDLMGGQIAMAFDATPTAMPLAKSGKLRALGAGMAKRVAAMPDLPTLQEQGLPGFECYTWNVFLALPARQSQSSTSLTRRSTNRWLIPRFPRRWKKRVSTRHQAARLRPRANLSGPSLRNGRLLLRPRAPKSTERLFPNRSNPIS